MRLFIGGDGIAIFETQENDRRIAKPLPRLFVLRGAIYQPPKAN